MNIRSAYWDNVKSILIILVVFAHAFYYSANTFNYLAVLEVFINTFHMPLFIFVSGFFYSSKNLKEKLLYYAVLSLYCILMRGYNGCVLWGLTSFTLHIVFGHEWYLVAIIIFYLVCWLIEDVDEVFVVLVSILIGCIANYDKVFSSDPLLCRVLVWFPFFYLGVIFNKYKDKCKMNILNFNKVISGFILGGYLIALWINRENVMSLLDFVVPRKPYVDLQYGNALLRLINYLLVIILGVSFFSLIPARKIRFITNIGERSLQIYLYHVLIRNEMIFYKVEPALCSTPGGQCFYLLLWIIIFIMLSTKVVSVPTEYIKRAIFRKYRMD